jgi:aryl-alcohol dehydrogenase-like predicted oxidoreductase
MEYRQVGYSGVKVPVLAFGTGTFGAAMIFSGLGNYVLRRRRVLPTFAWTQV